MNERINNNCMDGDLMLGGSEFYKRLKINKRTNSSNVELISTIQFNPIKSG